MEPIDRGVRLRDRRGGVETGNRRRALKVHENLSILRTIDVDESIYTLSAMLLRCAKVIEFS